MSASHYVIVNNPNNLCGRVLRNGKKSMQHPVGKLRLTFEIRRIRIFADAVQTHDVKPNG